MDLDLHGNHEIRDGLRAMVDNGPSADEASTDDESQDDSNLSGHDQHDDQSDPESYHQPSEGSVSVHEESSDRESIASEASSFKDEPPTLWCPASGRAHHQLLDFGYETCLRCGQKLTVRPLPIRPPPIASRPGASRPGGSLPGGSLPGGSYRVPRHQLQQIHYIPVCSRPRASTFRRPYP